MYVGKHALANYRAGNVALNSKAVGLCPDFLLTQMLPIVDNTIRLFHQDVFTIFSYSLGYY
jgi:hypothetical protein